MKICVLVNVHYDHFRFQENLYASNNIEDVKRHAKENYPKVEIIDYEMDDSVCDDLWMHETPHLWIQEF